MSVRNRSEASFPSGFLVIEEEGQERKTLEVSGGRTNDWRTFRFWAFGRFSREITKGELVSFSRYHPSTRGAVGG